MSVELVEETEETVWTDAEKTQVNQDLSRARYSERMRQMQARRSGKGRNELKRDKLTQGKGKVQAVRTDAPAKSRAKRTQRLKKQQNKLREAKDTQAKEDQTVFHVGGEENGMTVHLDE